MDRLLTFFGVEHQKVEGARRDVFRLGAAPVMRWSILRCALARWGQVMKKVRHSRTYRLRQRAAIATMRLLGLQRALVMSGEAETLLVGSKDSAVFRAQVVGRRSVARGMDAGGTAPDGTGAVMWVQG